MIKSRSGESNSSTRVAYINGEPSKHKEHCFTTTRVLKTPWLYEHNTIREDENIGLVNAVLKTAIKL